MNMLDEAKALAAHAATHGYFEVSGCITMLVREIEERDKKLRNVLDHVEKQAEDDGLWFFAETAPEAYLQQELRKLHSLMEALA